ncbi:MAG: UDP-2,3-diacylglucosamine diphosphatase LpxI [Phycisphaerales bacterium]|nr:UDP-2,3-diacylglucosamine diphosphatase LpxI [Planctomycetota bacterium]MBL6996912.1 UDP-2,3-diacylglucosamine diphosphatase LpxI [Phycisphaerales bacterium]
MATKPILGMIAGNGILPIIVARSASASGFQVCCVGLRGQCAPELAAECDTFKYAGMARIGRWIRLLKKWGVRDTVMVGGVGKAVMHDPFATIRLMPDITGLLLWYRTLRHDRRDATVLGAIADELQKSGVTLIDSTTHIPNHLTGNGTLGNVTPSAKQVADIDFGWPLLTQSAALHIGQSIAVRDGDVLAVEAIEGTAALIERAGSLCKKNGWTLLKTAADDHDMRADVPSIGTKTIEQVAAAGCSCIALGSGRVILLDSQAVIEAANNAGVALVGVSNG